MRVTEFETICVFCGRPKEATHHLVFGNWERSLAEADGLTVPVCNRCHNLGSKTESIHGNERAEALSRICGQLAFEKNKVEEGATGKEAREAFRARYGISYL